MSRWSRLTVWRRANGRAWCSFGCGFGVGVATLLLLGALVVAPWLLTHRSSLPLEEPFGDYAVSLASRIGGGGMKNPLEANRQTLERGQYAYTGSCAKCHGPAGDAKGGVLAAALFPPATNLAGDAAKAKSDGQLFWITKNGLSFAGMPAFSDQYNDEAIWAIVAYVRVLQGRIPPGGSAARPLAVPTPSTAELARASLTGDRVAKGAAVYFGANCSLCHGGSGNGPGELGLRITARDSDAFLTCIVRNGPNGMPAYGADRLSDGDISNLIAYLRSFPTPAPRAGAGQGGPPVGGPGAGQQSSPPPGGGQGDPPGHAYSSPPGTDTSNCMPTGPGGAPPPAAATPTPVLTPAATPEPSPPPDS